MIPVAVTIAGSDNSAGAGIQADLKTFTRLGVYGQTVITCVVAEVPGRVAAIQPVDSGVVRDQLSLSLEYFPVRTLKTGMLYSSEIIETVCDVLEKKATPASVLVVDPVMVASSGDPLLLPDAIDSYRQRLIPLAALVTPNLDEAAMLLGHKVEGRAQLGSAARELQERFGVPFLLKGGHLKGDEAVDVLAVGEVTEQFSAPFIRAVSTHGTGCTYSAAITAHLARGDSLRDAVAAAKQFITEAIRQTLSWEAPRGRVEALAHFGG
jgi:hydroxymethylpyrimidine/phosphomethylpyrimidine kinase